MEAFVKTLQVRMDQELQKIDPEESPVQGCDRRLKTIEETIVCLRKYITEHPFRKPAAEIYYNKKVAPLFFSQYFFYSKLYNTAVKKMSCQREEYHGYLKNEGHKIAASLLEYGDFYPYFISGKDCLDEKYYTQASRTIWSDHIAVVTENWLCPGSYRASWILANRRYEEYIAKELQEPEMTSTRKASTLEFKGTKAQLVELAVALCESKLFHGKGQAATLGYFKDWMEEQFDLDLKDFFTIDRNNRARKKESTPFLTLLTEKYISRADHLLD